MYIHVRTPHYLHSLLLMNRIVITLCNIFMSGYTLIYYYVRNPDYDPD